MPSIHKQQRLLTINERVILWICRSFLRKRLDPRETRTPNLQIDAEYRWLYMIHSICKSKTKHELCNDYDPYKAHLGKSHKCPIK